jgi:hypothetical protein
MNKDTVVSYLPVEDFLLELKDVLAIDGRVSIDRYCKVLDLVNKYFERKLKKDIDVASNSNSNEAVVASHTCTDSNSIEQKKLDAINKIIDSYDWENGDPGDIINRIQNQL